MSESMPGINKQKTFGWRSLNLSFLPLIVFVLVLEKIAFPSEDQTLRGLEKKFEQQQLLTETKSKYFHQTYLKISLTIVILKPLN
jgi:hypothetical protein